MRQNPAQARCKALHGAHRVISGHVYGLSVLPFRSFTTFAAVQPGQHLDGMLQEASEVLAAIGVNLPVHVLLRMVDGAVNVGSITPAVRREAT